MLRKAEKRIRAQDQTLVGIQGEKRKPPTWGDTPLGEKKVAELLEREPKDCVSGGHTKVSKAQRRSQ